MNYEKMSQNEEEGRFLSPHFSSYKDIPLSPVHVIFRGQDSSVRLVVGFLSLPSHAGSFSPHLFFSLSTLPRLIRWKRKGQKTNSVTFERYFLLIGVKVNIVSGSASLVSQQFPYLEVSPLHNFGTDGRCTVDVPLAHLPLQSHHSPLGMMEMSTM